MTCAVLLITDVLFDRPWAVLAAVLTGLGFAVFWYGLAGIAWLRDLRSN
jgi:hypothetical protein